MNWEEEVGNQKRYKEGVLSIFLQNIRAELKAKDQAASGYSLMSDNVREIRVSSDIRASCRSDLKLSQVHELAVTCDSSGPRTISLP